MKAAQINSYGGKDVLKTVDGAAKAQAQEGQVLVEVYAAGANPFDLKVREGYLKDMVALNFPATLGGDFAGVVAGLGEGVSGLNVGDEVYGQANALGGQGSFAEFTAAKAGQTALKPKIVDFHVAAAIPLAGVSAYQALVEHANLQNGQKVLIHGGAGGIGTFAVQIAKHLGAYVAATAAASDAEFVKGLGADEVIDYKSQKFEDVLKDYDAVFDTVGGETYKKSYQVLKPGGVLVSMTEKPDRELTKKHGVNAISQQTKTTADKLKEVAKLVELGAIKVNVDKVFPLDDAGEALEYLKVGHPKGKVVIKVK
jgi:NADPH:quinone reductase-like Zn-dependent oxidoreductase